MNPLEKILPVYYVVSHGGCLKFPILVGTRAADALMRLGVKVLTVEEYKKELE